VFKINYNDIAKNFKKPLTELLQKNFELSESEAENYVEELIRKSINSSDSTLQKTLIELSERKK
jgi:hypothetical protein